MKILKANSKTGQEKPLIIFNQECEIDSIELGDNLEYIEFLWFLENDVESRMCKIPYVEVEDWASNQGFLDDCDYYGNTIEDAYTLYERFNDINDSVFARFFSEYLQQKTKWCEIDMIAQDLFNIVPVNPTAIRDLSKLFDLELLHKEIVNGKHFIVYAKHRNFENNCNMFANTQLTPIIFMKYFSDIPFLEQEKPAQIEINQTATAA